MILSYILSSFMLEILKAIILKSYKSQWKAIENKAKHADTFSWY